MEYSIEELQAKVDEVLMNTILPTLDIKVKDVNHTPHPFKNRICA